MLGTDVSMTQTTSLGHRVRHHLLDARRQGNRFRCFGLFGAWPNLFLNGSPDRLEVEPHATEHIHGDAFAQLDEAEQNVLSAYVTVIEATSFSTGEFHDLTGAGSKVVVFVLIHSGGVTPKGY